MVVYQVVDVNSDGVVVVLRDQVGKYHIGWTVEPTFSLHDEVVGGAPRLGYQMLASSESSAVHSVVIDAIDCTPKWAHRLTHPEAAARHARP